MYVWGRRAVRMGITAVLAAATSACWPAAPQVLELGAEGGVIQLREPLRPIRGSTRLLLVALDGIGDDDLRRAIHDGHLPAVARLVGREVEEDVYERAYAVPGALSVLPSNTMSGWATVFSGEPPGRTGIPGNEWFDRTHRRFYAPGPVSVDDYTHTLKVYTEGLLNEQVAVPTLFERLDLRAHVALLPVFRGADLMVTPSPRALAELTTRLAAGLIGDDPIDRAPYEAIDTAAVNEAIALMDEAGVPDLQVVYFPGADLYTHSAQPPLAQQQRYLHDVVSPALQRLFDRYAALDAFTDTYVLFVADHGHTPVLRDERHALATDPERDPPALLTRAGYRPRPFVLDEADEDDYQAVLSYQGAFAMVHVADRSTCPTAGDRCDWTAPARWAEDILPLARAFASANTGALVPDLRDTIDLIFVRPGAPAGAAREPFAVWHDEQVIPIGDYLQRTPRPDLLRLDERLEDLATGPLGDRAGDLLVLARSGMHRPIEERFYFSSVNHSWHGSPQVQDSQIPILVAHPHRAGRDLRAFVAPLTGEQPSQRHVVPLIEALLRAPPE